MYLEPLFYNSVVRDDGSFDRKKYPDLRVWVIKAIAEEEKNPNDQLWKKEPSAEFQKAERQRRIRFLRKHENNNPLITAVADRLSSCHRGSRCCSGACPECGRLIQRWFVRKSKSFIRDVIDKVGRDLVAISIIPVDSIIRPGQLGTFSITNFQRTLKYALDQIELAIALGGIDFSFNEDQKAKYQPFWCPHFYFITSTANAKRLKRHLKEIYESNKIIPRPVKISDFHNSPRRRSYAFKIYFRRRIGNLKIKWERGIARNRRNTSRDKLRAKERLELFVYLNQIGLTARFIIRGAKTIASSAKVTIRKI